MKRLIPASVCMAALLIASTVIAQDGTPVRFSFKKQRTSAEEVKLSIKAEIAPGVKLYDLQWSKDDVLYSNISFDSLPGRRISPNFTSSIIPITATDPGIGVSARCFVDSVTWQQTITVAETDSFLLKGRVDYMYRKGDDFLSGEEPFKLFIQPNKSDGLNAALNSSNEINDQSLWWIFLAAFGGGVLALLTPCVYSMIPVTVSFFTKRSPTRTAGIRNALYYAASIVFIFTLLGFLVTLVFGPAALNNLATNWIANLGFFLLFVAFGVSFLGAFEIRLPSSWMNKSDAKAGTGNFIGIFFMALTLVLVSFSCTGPIIGNLLVLAAKGNYFGPLIGMLGFSLALALPFALFAFFPSKLNALGKAGGWLNAVKVTLGFLELALALKFLSNADLVKGWRLLDREVFISLWITIFLLLGIYLLGKLKFHHDDELPRNDFGVPFLSIPRLFFAIASISFAIYMMPGLWGAPLKAISAFVPPMGTQDFIAKGSVRVSGSNDQVLPRPVKYFDRMKIYEPEVVTSNGLTTYYDYGEALAVARKLKRPLMLDFTGINCVNCRKMEGEVWSNPEVIKKLKENFVIVSLYVDVQNIDLPESEEYYSGELKKKVSTLGDKNADLQVTKYASNSQPYYFFLDAGEKRLIPHGYGYDPSVQKFNAVLDSAIAKYRQVVDN